MDVDSEPLNSEENVEDCLMTDVEENVNCTCDCGCSSSKCVVVTADDIINQTFETSDAAYHLYVRYARKREHKALTHTGCEAMLAVYFDTKTSAWRVKKLVEKHNHDLVPQCLVHLIPNHCGMNEAQKAQANTMHDNGLPSAKIMGLMVGQARGYANVGFTKKDLDNHIERTRRAKLIGGDSNATISYLLGKADVDPMAMARYSATDESRLANLFWADGIYVMLNKSPSVVVTDGDEAMKAAIQEIFPNATHQLCGWHIQKNVTANIKSKGFSDEVEDEDGASAAVAAEDQNWSGLEGVTRENSLVQLPRFSEEKQKQAS
ncbi:hypothetical protein AHAS_Ahas17G0221300 [Arachis hypogaea]